MQKLLKMELWRRKMKTFLVHEYDEGSRRKGVKTYQTKTLSKMNM